MADGENDILKVKATSPEKALAKAKALVRHASGASPRAVVYIDWIIRNNLQMLDPVKGVDYFEPEVQEPPYIIKRVAEQFHKELEKIYRCGAISEEEEKLEVILHIIALHRAAEIIRTPAQYHGLEARLQHF